MERVKMNIFLEKSVLEKFSELVPPQPGKTINVSLLHEPIEEFFPEIGDKLVDQMLSAPGGPLGLLLDV